MNDDIAKIAKWATANGWRVEDDASGHTRFYAPSGGYVTAYPSTPSNPTRRMADLIVALRAVGLGWPPPSKSEKRSARRKAKKEQGQ